MQSLGLFFNIFIIDIQLSSNTTAMKLKILGTMLVASFSLALLTGCASSGSGSQMEKKSENKATLIKEYSTLEDYLRQLNGVTVTGSGSNIQVSIRSGMSLTDSNEQPLYVLNGREVGNRYSQVVQMISPGSIISVEAVPPSRASLYGMRGIAGAIVIKTE